MKVTVQLFLGWNKFTISVFSPDTSINESDGGFCWPDISLFSLHMMNVFHSVKMTERPRMRDTNTIKLTHFWKLEIPNLVCLKPNPNMPWDSSWLFPISRSLEGSWIESICKVKKALLNNPFHTRRCLCKGCVRVQLEGIRGKSGAHSLPVKTDCGSLWIPT